MEKWTLIRETTTGMGEHKRWSVTVLGEVRGSRETAMARLEQEAREYEPEHPWTRASRRRLFRHGEGFLLVAGSYVSRFTVAELLYDSEPSAGQPDITPPDTARDEDGIPVRPSWLGRPDLG
ncbi:hypothetical protein AB0N23_10630 [Streptomyces sp. NPDC052644]|uniref:hypothetical protein n=1 Tax=Streptomyces sp. enrichment culture TaxID=1795815 RepID=UPI0034249567